ncbi:MAG TPA: hypothetical protein VFB21_07275 [Chthonomonadaceae bacterium]|nr:hypothetical protein [Chthonomonadaceae bacterium]
MTRTNFTGRLRTLLSSLCLLSAAVAPATAHEDEVIKTLPPTKAKPQLAAARKQMDAAKMKLTAQGRYACCIQAPPGSNAAGCDLCAKENGSCQCGASLAQGKGVCGECLGAWQAGKGAFPGIAPKSVTLLASPHQKMEGKEEPPAPPELGQARETLNNAKRTLVKEGRFTCCVGHGGCDECAYEASCPCGRQAVKGPQGEGVCPQCFDGWHAGIGRLSGLTAQEMKMEPMPMAGMHGMMGAFAGISEMQEASGTAWQPAATPMYALHQQSGRWALMTHYNAFLAYDRQDGPRGDYQYNSINWAMLMARRPIKNDELMLRAMLSLEPLTVTPRGYPLLFQTGESYGGGPLVDRQHPHDFFMELAARYRHPLGKESGLSLYFAPSGEPALGPVAFPHRLSAMDNPAAPIGHHWQDGSHITFGVLTLGGWHRNVQLEGSIFTGREPDEQRWNFDPMRFDSYSGRITYNPGPNWSLQASYGFLRSPEALHPGEDVRRTTASAMYVQPRRDGGFWANTFVWGRNNIHRADSDSFLLESSLNLANRNTLFARMEYVQKSGEELNLAPMDKRYDIGQFTLGTVHDFTPNRSYQMGVGASVTFTAKPAELDALYGSSPVSYWLFLRIRPAPMRHSDR